MHQVATPIWNTIAQRPEIRNANTRKLFQMNQQDLMSTLDRQAQLLTKEGYSNKVILAYQTVLPLAAENPAIQAYLRETGGLDLMRALPDVPDVESAIELATKEYQLTKSQQQELLRLLTTSSQNAAPSAQPMPTR